ncbi:helix-turn-helix domain-containing protein [Paraburkholderia bannensis]|uniref:helix-turn-helix domain-containing protein n=1 Tax=Paraburkholderia bannensis TaxID=765414 RepID=UPI002ABDB80B|nr:helix-turn-helix transcriptional regulator [Paraburkholderia bannensis]
MAENISPRQALLRARIAKNLKFFRGKLGMSQELLADRAGLHRTHVGLIEKGQTSARTDTLVVLAEALGVDELELLAERDEALPPALKRGRKKKSEGPAED